MGKEWPFDVAKAHVFGFVLPSIAALSFLLENILEKFYFSNGLISWSRVQGEKQIQFAARAGIMQQLRTGRTASVSWAA